MTDGINGGPAFPRTGVGNAGTSYDVPAQDGMAVLDYFAGRAMQGIVSACSGPDVEFPGDSGAARMAYDYAEAMLAERKKRQGGGS